MGRVLLARLAPEQAEETLSRIEFRRFTERTAVGVEKLRQILRVVQRNGCAIVDQELEHGLRTVAVPIGNPARGVVAALEVAVNAQRVSIQELRTRFLHHLRAAAAELCMFLG
jgi:IclR family transcriptional regulator, pca regulon regulatory protein